MTGLTFDQSLKFLSIIGAIGSFVWGVWVWQDKADKERAQARLDAARYAETRRVEAAKPFLDRQLALFTEATQVASFIAKATGSTASSPSASCAAWLSTSRTRAATSWPWRGARMPGSARPLCPHDDRAATARSTPAQPSLKRRCSSGCGVAFVDGYASL